MFSFFYFPFYLIVRRFFSNNRSNSGGADDGVRIKHGTHDTVLRYVVNTQSKFGVDPAKDGRDTTIRRFRLHSDVSGPSGERRIDIASSFLGRFPSKSIPCEAIVPYHITQLSKIRLFDATTSSPPDGGGSEVMFSFAFLPLGVSYRMCRCVPSDNGPGASKDGLRIAIRRLHLGVTRALRRSRRRVDVGSPLCARFWADFLPNRLCEMPLLCSVPHRFKNFTFSMSSPRRTRRAAAARSRF